MESGAYHDGYGKRLWLFHLYFLLGHLDEAATYMAWYEAEFFRDAGEEAQLLWALLLHRMGRDDEARYQLARAFDRNPVFLNTVAAGDDQPYNIWSEDVMAMRASQVPQEVLDAITHDEYAWLVAQNGRRTSSSSTRNATWTSPAAGRRAGSKGAWPAT